MGSLFFLSVGGGVAGIAAAYHSRSMSDPIDLRTTLEGWLRERMPEAPRLRISEPRKPTAGQSSDTQLFSIELDPDAGSESERIDAVLRCAPREGGPFPEYDLGLQAHVMRAVGATGRVPVPEVLWLEEDPGVLGVPFLVMRVVDGEAPLDWPTYQGEGFYKDASPETRAHMWRGTIEAVAKLHALDWRALGGGRVPGTQAGDDPATAALGYWRRYLDTFLKDDPREAVPVFDDAIAFLEQERPKDARLALCWGDAKLGNVLFAPGTRDVAAVIDWEMATIGDPEADLASLHLSDLRAQDAAGGVALPGTPDVEELIALYERASGLPVQHFHYNLVFATFWRGSVQIAVMRQLRRKGADLADELFVDNFPIRQLRRQLGI
ncbi:MAG: phosphotransferase family protein [Spirochaetaceae bacterium]|nr:phosphotransferase family protein [Myxococcales bacterium]MCB9724891.1 phosphotransferase family protein [Spirochaetaceae bacterium]